MKCLITKILVIILLATQLVVFPKTSLAQEDVGQRLARLGEEISKYESEIQRLKSETNTLSNVIAQYNAQITLTQLKITQTEEKIVLLGGRIDQLEGSLSALQLAYTQRVARTYKMSRFTEGYLLFISLNNIQDAINSFSYLKRLQAADIDLLNRLEKAQVAYKEEKSGQEKLQIELEYQKKSLAAQKNAKAQLLEQTKNDERKYQSLLAEAKSQLRALQRFVTSQGGASILQNQTRCDGWGCYYNQRDALWGNIGLGGSNYSVAEYGCLVTSVSMIASHYGKNIRPTDIAINSSAFVPGTGYLSHSPFTANGVTVDITSASKSMLDSELAAGRPTIVGLYSGPDHFIVILRKEGDDYIMHDPFLENGASRRLSEKYSTGNITSIRLVSFN